MIKRLILKAVRFLGYDIVHRGAADALVEEHAAAWQDHYEKKLSEEIEEWRAHFEKKSAEEIEAWRAHFEKESAAEIEEWRAQYEKEHAAEIEAWRAHFENEHAAEIEAWRAHFEKESAAEIAAWRAHFEKEDATEIEASIAAQSRGDEVRATSPTEEDAGAAPSHEKDVTEMTAEAAIGTDVGPYMVDSKTYNPMHPDYDANLAKNFPGCFYDISTVTERTDRSSTNPAFKHFSEIKMLALRGHDPANYDFMAPYIEAVARDLEGDANYLNFLDKTNELEDFIGDLNKNHPGEYHSGSVSTEDGKFLYYLIRLVEPKTVVQTGVSNGTSCAYITLALKHSGRGGKLYAIDIPYIYDPADENFHQEKLYGVLIPNGKTSGWLVPDGLKESFECWSGDAKELLPKLFEKLGEADVFYHDSDHTYDHMWFEFETALPFMRRDGLIVADDIAWSSATWDFAQHIGCHAFNHRGSQGLIFV